MRKFSLDVGKLKVQSFQTDGGAEKRRGTVRAHGATYRQWSCDGTCDQTCGVPASCELVNTYCGTYPDQGCPNSIWYCTDDVYVC